MFGQTAAAAVGNADEMTNRVRRPETVRLFAVVPHEGLNRVPYDV
jgi:hypothetical protein